MKAMLIGLLLINASLAASSSINKIQAYFAVTDFTSACEEAKEALVFYPNDILLHETLIKALGQSGNEKGLWDAWNHYRQLFPEESESNQDLQEAMAWGTITSAKDSSLPMIRLFALLASFFGNDAKSIPFLQHFCHDNNSLVRRVAVQLASSWRDAALCDEILLLWEKEKNHKVRLEIIKAIGKMKIKRGYSKLIALVADPCASAEEKVAAISAVVFLFDEIDRQEILHLAESQRAGLRQLACEVVIHLRSHRDFDLMLRLASDNHPEVRMVAIRALGLLKEKQIEHAALISLAQDGLKDPYPEVAISAAWLLTLLEPSKGRDAFLPLMAHPKRAIRHLSAAALTATGHYGSKILQELFYHHSDSDSFVKMNLALGMIYQRENIFDACHALQRGLEIESGRWMWDEGSPFRALVPSTIKQDEEIMNAPEAVNQMTRLEILNLLAMVKYPDAEKAIREFLYQHKWGITGLAAAVLLMEGDESSLNLVQDLLKDSDPRIQMQAALALSLWGGKEEAIDTLQKGYPTADRETKEKILEGLAKIGSRRSVPFLLSILQEPQQSLRLIGAAALLQCLYH